MKKILPCLMVFAAITAHAQSDSIPPSLPPTYPYLTPISTVEELNADVMSLKFSKADANAKKLITAAKRKKQSTAEYDKVVARCRKGENGLRGVDRVIIVDSVVVDKKDFLKAYPIAADMGSLTLSEKGDIVQYQTQLNGMVLYPVHATDSTDLQIMRYYLENDRLTEGEAIEGLGIEGWDSPITLTLMTICSSLTKLPISDGLPVTAINHTGRCASIRSSPMSHAKPSTTKALI